MKPIRQEHTTTGAKSWIPLDPHISPFEVSCFAENGTSTFEYTVDDIQNTNITPVVAGTVSSNLLNVPATAVRINISVAGAPTIFKVLQAGLR